MVLIVLVFFIANNNLSSTNRITGSAFPVGDHIASVRINDIIFDDFKRVRKLAEIEKDNKAKALIVNINSQGGSVVGSEMLYNSLRKISESKPVVVVMESVAASGGYLALLVATI